MTDVLEELHGGYIVARATADRVSAIVGLLADDGLGAGRERPIDDPVYTDAFRAIGADPNQLLVVVLDDSDRVVGTLQLTFIPGLSRGGALRAQIESVRVASTERGSGLGSALFEWAIGYSRDRGARLLQLTSDKSRSSAIAFYERLGFVASHEGMKLAL